MAATGVAGWVESVRLQRAASDRSAEGTCHQRSRGGDTGASPPRLVPYLPTAIPTLDKAAPPLDSLIASDPTLTPVGLPSSSALTPLPVSAAPALKSELPGARDAAAVAASPLAAAVAALTPAPVAAAPVMAATVSWVKPAETLAAVVTTPPATTVAEAASPPAAAVCPVTAAPVAAVPVLAEAASGGDTVAETPAVEVITPPATTVAAAASPPAATVAALTADPAAVAPGLPSSSALTPLPVSAAPALKPEPAEVHQAVGGHLGRDDLRRGMELLPSEASEPEWECSRVRRSPVKGARSRRPIRSSR